MIKIALQQISGDYAQKNARKTLESPVAYRFLKDYLNARTQSALGYPEDNTGFFLWGAKSERSHQTSQMFPEETLVLFRKGEKITKCGVFISETYNPALAQNLWGLDKDGKTWVRVWFFKRIWDINLDAAEINKLMGYKPEFRWQGLIAVGDGNNQIVTLVREQLGKT